MRVVIVGKNCYSVRRGDRAAWPTLSGHTIAFTRPLVDFLLREGHKVALVAPWNIANGDSQLEGIELPPPDRLVLRYVDDRGFRKVSLGGSALDLILGIEDAAGELGGVDWLLFVYAFPSVLFAVDAASVLRCRTAAFLRGGDGYKFLSPGGVQVALGATHGSLLAALYRQQLQRATRVFTVSEWLAREVERQGVRVSGIIPSPAVASDGSFQPSDMSHEQRKRTVCAQLNHRVRAGAPLDPTRNWLITAGRFARDKRIGLIVESFAHWSPDSWHLVICGAGPEEESVLSDIAALRLEEHVTILRLTPLELADLLRSGDAYLHAAVPDDLFIDARPSAVTSAAYYGLPVVLPVADVGGADESLSVENTQVLGFEWRHGDIGRSIGEVLRRLEDAGTRHRLGEANRHVAAAFSEAAIFSGLVRELSTEDVP